MNIGIRADDRGGAARKEPAFDAPFVWLCLYCLDVLRSRVVAIAVAAAAGAAALGQTPTAVAAACAPGVKVLAAVNVRAPQRTLAFTGSGAIVPLSVLAVALLLLGTVALLLGRRARIAQLVGGTHSGARGGHRALALLITLVAVVGLPLLAQHAASAAPATSVACQPAVTGPASLSSPVNGSPPGTVGGPPVLVSATGITAPGASSGTPVAGAGGAGAQPPTAMPESPLAVLLPVAGLGLLAAVVTARRRGVARVA